MIWTDLAAPHSLSWGRGAPNALREGLTYFTSSGMFQDKAKMPNWL